MDLRQLSYFVRVTELRSFTKAAEALRISQPAIGEQIKNLEEELNATLLIRHSRGVEPTEAGRILLNKARGILSQVAEARSAVREYEEGLRGDVTIGLTTGLSEAFAASLVEYGSLQFPGVSINVIEDLSSSLIRRVAAGDEPLSFAVVSGYDLSTTSKLNATRLFAEDLYVVGSGNLLGKTNQPLEFREMAQFRLILPGSGSPAQQGLKGLLRRMAQESDVELSIAYEIQAISVIMQLVEREVGVAILPFDTVRGRVNEGRLNARLITAPSVTRELNLIWNAQRLPTSAEDTIMNILVKMIRDSRKQNAG